MALEPAGNEKLAPPGTHYPEAVEGRRESTFLDHRRGSQFDPVNEGVITEDVNKLKRNLHGRHMQMIAIGTRSPVKDDGGTC